MSLWTVDMCVTEMYLDRSFFLMFINAISRQIKVAKVGGKIV